MAVAHFVKKLFIPACVGFMLIGLSSPLYSACDPEAILKKAHPDWRPIAVHQHTTAQGTLHWVKLSPTQPLQAGISSPLATVEALGHNTNAQLLINGGFFDPANGKTVSHVTLSDGTHVSPADNERLTSNENLKPWMPAIGNRSELRRLQCGKTFRYSIAPHSEALPTSCSLVWSLGGGPQLAPALTASSEAFFAKDPQTGKITRDPIGLYRGSARSAVAITESGDLMIALGQKPPGKPGWTLPQLSEALTELGATQILALDGGSSSSLWVSNHWFPGLWNNASEPVKRAIYSYLWLPTP